MAVFALVAGMVLSEVLLAAGPLYTHYGDVLDRPFGLTQATDQRRAGLLMTAEQIATLGSAAALLFWSHVERLGHELRDRRLRDRPLSACSVVLGRARGDRTGRAEQSDSSDDVSRRANHDGAGADTRRACLPLPRRIERADRAFSVAGAYRLQARIELRARRNRRTRHRKVDELDASRRGRGAVANAVAPYTDRSTRRARDTT